MSDAHAAGGPQEPGSSLPFKGGSIQGSKHGLNEARAMRERGEGEVRGEAGGRGWVGRTPAGLHPERAVSAPSRHRAPHRRSALCWATRSARLNVAKAPFKSLDDRHAIVLPTIVIQMHAIVLQMLPTRLNWGQSGEEARGSPSPPPPKRPCGTRHTLWRARPARQTRARALWASICGASNIQQATPRFSYQRPDILLRYKHQHWTSFGCFGCFAAILGFGSFAASTLARKHPAPPRAGKPTDYQLGWVRAAHYVRLQSRVENIYIHFIIQAIRAGLGDKTPKLKRLGFGGSGCGEVPWVPDE